MPRYIDADKIKYHFIIFASHQDAIAFKKDIKAMPNEDVAPFIYAKWIPATNGRGGHECSLCHNYAPSFKTGDEWLTNYCPNCGAKMDEEERND